MADSKAPKSKSLYNDKRKQKHLVKVLIHEPEENLKYVRRLIRRYKPNSVQFFTYLNKQQIAALKGAYKEKISIIYGELLRRDRFDRVPEDLMG